MQPPSLSTDKRELRPCKTRHAMTALLAALIDAADNWHAIKRLEHAVFTDNTRAIRLYESFGFEAEGVQRAFAFRAGHCVDALGMARVWGLGQQ